MYQALRAFWGAAILIWVMVPIIAAPPLTITDTGYYLTILDSSGAPSLVKIDTIVDLTLGDAPAPKPPPDAPPTDPPAPVPPDLDIATVKGVQAWATEIADPSGSQAVAAVYSHVRGAFADGLLTESSVWSALKTATDDALTIVSPDTNWAPFRKQLSALITLDRQRGTLTSKSEINRLLASTKQGLDMSADGSPMLSDEDLVAIAIKTNEAIDAQ